MFYEKIYETKNKDFPLYTSTCTVKPRQYMDGLHWHEELEILCCFEGEAIVVCNKEQWVLHPGELAVINPFNLHTLYSRNGCVRHCLLIRQHLLADIGCQETAFRHFFTDEAAFSVCRAISREMEEDRPYSQKEILSLTMHLLVQLCRNFTDGELTNPGSAGRHKVAREAMTYIDHHFLEVIDIDSVCTALGYSRSHVCHSFKQITGGSLGQYIITRRLHHANALLATGRYTVKECAYLCGFQTIGYFSRMYKKTFGIPPSELPAQ